MSPGVQGIHHVTAFAGDPQNNVDFYAGILGLRLVKKTINFDAPQTYHLYYGNEAGSPGTLMTFFPWTSRGWRGGRGTGQVGVTSFSIPDGATGYWTERLKQNNMRFTGPFTRFDEEVIVFRDLDGLELELVSSVVDARPSWDKGSIPSEYAIRGFHSVALWVEGYERTAGLMTETLGFRQMQESGNRFRYSAGNGGPGAIVDILCLPEESPGQMGVGTVHHVAWRVPDDEAQLNLRRELVKLGYNVPPVVDRQYFHSIYFREPGHVLFEAATDPPGFAIDEKLEELGTHLMLPPWLEKERAAIEQSLSPITLPVGAHSEKPS